MTNILLDLIKVITSAFTSIIDAIKKYGKSIVLWGMMLFLFLSMAFYFILMNNKLLDKFLNQIEEKERIEQIDEANQHEQNITNRRELNLKVYNELNKFFYLHKCVQDVAIMEYHNTYQNLAQKPFIYVSNTFELCKLNDTHFGSMQQITMSLFNVSNILYTNKGYYNNTIEGLKEDDAKLYSLVSDIKQAKHIYIKEIETSTKTNVSVGAIVVVSNEDYSKALEDTIFNLEEKISIFLA